MALTLGFVSVRQHIDHGYIGGYLIVNAMARPLEFHCTMTVRPSRAQVLLYGPTIDDFVCGEQIAKALFTKAKVSPQLVFTDTIPCLAVSCVSDVPIVGIAGPDNSHTTTTLLRPSNTQLAIEPFEVGHSRYQRAASSNQVEEVTVDCLQQLSERFDLMEPFSRIIEALMEAHPMIKAAA